MPFKIYSLYKGNFTTLKKDFRNNLCIKSIIKTFKYYIE